MTEVVSSILGPLVEKLASLGVKEIQLVCGVKDDREKLQSKLKMIQEVLADAEQKQIKDAAVKLWLSELKHFCYDVENVLDEFETRALWRRARLAERSILKRKVRYLSSWPSNFIFQFKMAHKMKELGKRLDVINEEKTKFKLSSDVQEMTIDPRGETHSFVPASNVIGRIEEKERITEFLLRSDDGGAGTIAVIPILGMGGAGKTTLAKSVYNDDSVDKHFDHKVWLYMPLKFEVEKLIRDIIKSLSDKEKCDSLSLDKLQQRLRNLVENKRCLFVMDDVWKMTREDWEGLRDLLGGVSLGSKVIVTSRDNSTAEIMGPVPLPPLHLANLSLKDSLELFKKCDFNQGQEHNHPHLMVIGKEIVSKCGGNPLAVKALGRLLYSKSNQSDWEYVRDSEIWELQTGILPSLRISYDLMPSYLKQCFAYCSIFPKNHEFENLDLIQLWISNGFIQSDGNKQEPEEIGREYLEELLSRSFLDVVREEYPILSFRMHDLIYELAISVAQTESCNMKAWAQDISSMTRHISFPDPSRLSKDEMSGCLSKLSHIRTIWLEEGSSGEFFLETCISRFKHLRVLWLEDSSFDQLPSSIGGLKHLRFLNLYGNENIKKLPKSVWELRNLQCLNLLECKELEELPADIKNMISLRALGITTKQLRLPEGGIGCLTSLRWLFIRGCENLEALFDDIQSLTSLRKLFIVECPKLASLPRGIKYLEALEDLWIVDCDCLRLPEGESNEPRSMSRLKTILLRGLPQVDTIPGWLEGSARTLQRITIERCPELSALPEWLRSCSSLRTLKIQSCPGLSSLPDGVRSIATLTELRISDCGELSSCGEEDDSD